MLMLCDNPRTSASTYNVKHTSWNNNDHVPVLTFRFFSASRYAIYVRLRNFTPFLWISSGTTARFFTLDLLLIFSDQTPSSQNQPKCKPSWIIYFQRLIFILVFRRFRTRIWTRKLFDKCKASGVCVNSLSSDKNRFLVRFHRVHKKKEFEKKKILLTTRSLKLKSSRVTLDLAREKFQSAPLIFTVFENFVRPKNVLRRYTSNNGKTSQVKIREKINVKGCKSERAFFFLSSSDKIKVSKKKNYLFASESLSYVLGISVSHSFLISIFYFEPFFLIFSPGIIQSSLEHFYVRRRSPGSTNYFLLLDCSPKPRLCYSNSPSCIKVQLFIRSWSWVHLLLFSQSFRLLPAHIWCFNKQSFITDSPGVSNSRNRCDSFSEPIEWPLNNFEKSSIFNYSEPS